CSSDAGSNTLVF
nr:immunoglobulin light chain junction region [Macaca mulatta]MPN66730.1 immunoglobulin light chain junction region [Macaca mulatta]MPN67499.1 immunoglobulin light chain junction region [Macaca mulatta]MPN67519.1 immunoglobulin light chain junction region [Macaca mulatta]MPN69062.1 immunoglobulin light chain junction region [Macaca mulatta]